MRKKYGEENISATARPQLVGQLRCATGDAISFNCHVRVSCARIATGCRLNYILRALHRRCACNLSPKYKLEVAAYVSAAYKLSVLPP